MKYLFVAVFVAVYFSAGLELGYTKASPCWTHLTFMFQHVGLFHLVINSVTLVGIFKAVKKSMNKYLLATIAISASSLCSFIPPAIYPMPTVGASGMIYVLMGVYLGINAKPALSKPMIIFIATIVIFLSVSFFKPNSNFYLHLLCLASGFAISGSRSYLQKHIHRRAD